MERSYKYCLLPSAEQKKQLENYFGVCRFAYNIGLETKIAAYVSTRTNLSCFDLINQIVELKTEYKWIAECPAQAIQMSLRNLDNAYTLFFKGAGFPKFKNKNSKQAIHFPQNTEVDFEKSKIRLPKLKWVECVFHRKFNGKIKTVTVTKTTTGKYFVSVLVENQNETPSKKQIISETTVGIDLGIKTLVSLSDGGEFINPKWLTSSYSLLRKEQRSLSRKLKGSNSREIQRLVVAKCHEKIANRRRDYLQKISTDLINRFDTICIEDLNVSGMMKNKKLSRAIGDAGWSSFISMLEYKAKWVGKNIIVIGRFAPSSKICSNCGAVNKELELRHRNWDCKKCLVTHSRDMNAAINIKNFGLRYKLVQANEGQ